MWVQPKMHIWSTLKELSDGEKNTLALQAIAETSAFG
jgi:hypothetical protein